ncbi:hypothetical protein [Myceligenerans cantabricum]
MTILEAHDEYRRTGPHGSHEHAWVTESSHRTSEGRVRYVRCRCGSRRVDLQPHPHLPPSPLSTTLGAPASRAHLTS